MTNIKQELSRDLSFCDPEIDTVKLYTKFPKRDNFDQYVKTNRPYRFDNAKMVGVLIVNKPFIRREKYLDHIVYPGEYPVYAKDNGNGALMFGVTFQTVIIGDTTAQLEIGSYYTLNSVEGGTLKNPKEYCTPFKYMQEAEFKWFLSNEEYARILADSMEVCAQFQAGCLTIKEITAHFQDVADKMKEHIIVSGAKCPFTGLPIPAGAEL